MSRLFEDPAYEQRLLDDLDRRFKRMENYRKQARETGVGKLLSDHARRYPYVTPGVLEAMARAGVPADSQSAEQLAAMSGQMNAQQGELAPGGKVNASWFRRNVIDPASAFGRTAVRTATTGLHGAFYEAVSRPITAVVESDKPVQSLLGMAPDEYMESYRSQGNSPMVRAFNAWRAGNGPQGLEDENFLGAGFVPGGRIYEEHREQLGARTVDGQTALERYGGDVSPGRTLAAEVIEPGTTGFDTVSGLLDLAAGIFLDPAAKIAKPIGAVNKARKTFGGTADMLPRTRAVLEGAQIVGPRKTTIARDVEDFLVRDNAGRRLVDDLVERTSAGDVWRMMGRKINPQTAREIARASDPDAVRAALRTTLGTSIREKPTATRLSRGIGRVAAPVVGPEGRVYGVGAATRHRFADGIRPRPSSKARLALSARMFNDVPGEQINVDDIGRAMHAVDEFAKNARLTPEVTTKHLDALAEIDADDPARVSKVWNVARDLMKDTDAALEDVWGRNPHLQDRLTKIVDDFETTFRQYAIDQVGSPMYFPGAKTSVAANGDTIVLPTVQILSEFMDMHVPLPSARAIRRDTSGVFKALEKVPHLREAAEISTMVADHYLMRAWKPAQLLRGAWAVRVIADEQARMAATGLNSAFNNPLSYIAWITGKRGNIDMTGSLIRQGQDFTDAMSRSSHWLGNDLPGTVRTGDYKQVRKGERDYARGWGDELNQLATEEGAQRIAGGLREGDRGYNPLTATSDQAIKDWFWNSDHLRQLDEGPARGLLSASRANADAYVDSVRARIHIKTGGAAELRNAAGETVDVASATADELAEARWVVTRDGDADLIAGLGQGKILDIPVHMTEPYDGMAKEIGKALQSKMSVGPEVVKVSRDLELKGRRGQRIALGDMYDKAIDFLYHNMMGKHTDALSRSPVFKQMYWDEAERLLSSMSQEVQDQVFKNARRAKLDRDTLSRMGRVVGDPNRVGDAVTDVLLADNIAKAHALNGTKKMLYDLSKRSQFADATRLLFPFGEAFKEVVTTWTRIGKENPASIERFRQVAMSGFFTEGPYGEEVFAYPGGDMPGLFGGMAGGGAGMMLGGMAGPVGALAGAGIGAAVGGAVGNAADPGGPGQIDMVGNASGLNLVTQSFLPGFGPIVQIPASIFLKEKPGIWADLEDLILPYGRSGASETGFLESMAPAWMKRALTAMQADPEQDRIFGNTVGHMHSMLYASGEYSDENGMVTPEQGRRLTEDATRHARWLFALRAVAQFVVPTGPQPQYSADTPEGLITFNALTEEYRNMAEDTEAGGWDTALDRFIERFGAQNTMALQAKTKERRKRSMGETGVAWERANPDLVEQFPNTVGWFAPEVEDDPFDYTAYKGAIARGDLETLTPEQQRMLHNHMLGRAAMAKVDAELGDRTDPGARAYRRDMRAWLKAEYPGFDSTIAAPIRADRDEMIAEFNRAVEHPKLKDSDIAKGWREYMQAREEAQSRLPEGLVTFKGQKAAHLARYLRDYGQYLAHEYPGFGEVFNRILESELRDEDEEAA